MTRKRFDFINGHYREHHEEIKNPSPLHQEKHNHEIVDCPKCGKSVFKVKDIYGHPVILDAYPDFDGGYCLLESFNYAAKKITKNKYEPMPRYRSHRC